MNQSERESIKKDLEKIAEALLARPCERATVGSGGKRCFDEEFERMSKRARNYGGGRMPVLKRDPERMCGECAALEYLNRAISELR